MVCHGVFVSPVANVYSFALLGITNIISIYTFSVQILEYVWIRKEAQFSLLRDFFVTPQNTLLLKLLVTKYVGFPPTTGTSQRCQLDVILCNSVLRLSTWR